MAIKYVVKVMAPSSSIVKYLIDDKNLIIEMKERGEEKTNNIPAVCASVCCVHDLLLCSVCLQEDRGDDQIMRDERRGEIIRAEQKWQVLKMKGPICVRDCVGLICHSL